ncbi:unnamed protein product [Paramecium sonneborni]|uniref:Uncharacterized protein n=1 Tax=Paramecium sonneborni TaxID=65129 RepID=A0A8S1KTY1_9CILI|nr:unnamed protein product [Paramecium sonneborni]
MKSLNLQFGDNRQNQREDMFLANIVEKVQLGKIGLISFVDQAQFIDLMGQKYKKKTKVQPVFNKIYAAIQVNLAKHQQSQQKKEEVSYEIKTISSTRQLGYRGSFNISNKSGAILLHKDSNLKEHLTYEFSDKEIQDQQILDEATKTERSKKNYRLSQITTDKNEIKGFKTIQTSHDNTQDHLLKQDNLSTARNEKQNYNLLTQEHSDQSQSQIKMESQQSCLIPSEKLRYGLNTNFTSELSNGQVQNQSATFNQLNNQQGQNQQQQPLTSRKQSDVLLKSIKDNYPQQAYLISQTQNNQRKTLTPVSQQKQPYGLIANQKQNDINYQQKNNNKIDKQQIIIKTQKGNHKQKQSQQDFKQQKKVQHKPYNSLVEKQQQIIDQMKIEQQKQITQETSFCQQQNNSQRATRRDLDERQQESPQFIKTDNIEDMIITHSPQQSQQKEFRQINTYRPETNPLNISEHSFQSKRHTLDQYDINSLMPPQSSRTLTSAHKDKTDQRNSVSNNSETDQKQHKNQLTVSFKRGSKRMKSHNIQGNENEYVQQEEDKIRRYSQERLFKSDNRFEKLEEDRYQYTINNLEQTGSSSSLNNYENENNNQINIQVSRCDNRENIIEEESLDGSMRQHKAILFSTQDRMHLKIGDNSYLPQSSSRSVAKSITPNTPMGSLQHSNNGTIHTNQVQKKKKLTNQHKRPQLSNEYSQTKISIQKQKSEDSYYEKEYTNESSQEPERTSRLKPKKLQQKLQPPPLQIQPQRRKSSAQVSPMDPRRMEQQEREKQKQIEYQKQIERMKLERELMEHYKIPEDMPLPQKKQIIESLIGELGHQHDQDVQYQVSLYNERQDQIQNIQKNYEEKIDFRYNIVNSCYYEMDYLCDHKLKLKQKDQEAQKIIHLKFQDQHYNNQPKLNQNGDKEEEEEGSPFKKQAKLVCNFDPVEIENQLKRRYEFVNETELLKFLKSFQSEFDKKVYQCNLDYPIQDIRQEDKQFTKGLIARNFKRKQTKNVTSKIEINNYQMDMNKIQYVKEKATKIQKLGFYLLMNS